MSEQSPLGDPGAGGLPPHLGVAPVFAGDDPSSTLGIHPADPTPVPDNQSEGRRAPGRPAPPPEGSASVPQISWSAEDEEGWRRLSFRHWPSLFSYYNITLAKRSVLSRAEPAWGRSLPKAGTLTHLSVFQVHQHPARHSCHRAREPPGGGGDAPPSGHPPPPSPHPQAAGGAADGPDALQVSPPPRGHMTAASPSSSSQRPELSYRAANSVSIVASAALIPVILGYIFSLACGGQRCAHLHSRLSSLNS